MGNIDTVEIKDALADPPLVILYLHRQGTEVSCPVDERCVSGLVRVLSEDGATFWLRSVSRVLIPFFGFWTRHANYELIVRVKHGSSRKEVTVPCSRKSGKAMLALALKDWSDAA